MKLSACLMGTVISALTCVAHAQIAIPTTTVGNANNAPDPLTGLGTVTYEYEIGIFEVTNTEYAAFLNNVARTDTHGLYNPNMGSNAAGGIIRSGSSGSYTYTVKSGFENMPVNYVSFWDATRFANWLTNGQLAGMQVDGITEDGMYDLNGITNPVNGSVTRTLDFAAGEAGFAVVSEAEWYKAAYFELALDGGDADNYWLYPTGTNGAPNGSESNYNANDGLEPDAIVNVGYSLVSPSGTQDQGGNVWEWNDTNHGENARGLLGGALNSSLANLRSNVAGDSLSTTLELSNVGFRISSYEPTIIPEPSSGVLTIMILGTSYMIYRRRRCS